MRFGKLLCNGNACPVGIGKDVLLQWNYELDGGRNEMQAAYRILVKGQDQMFDSGRIDGSEMKYELSDKIALQPGVKYRWQVICYPEKGGEICSEEAAFETAIDDLDASAWIACGVENPPSAPVFSKKFSVDTAALARARAYIFGLGLIRCGVNGEDCSDALLMPPNTTQDYRCLFETFDLTAQLKSGENCFSVQLGGGYNEDYSQYGYRYFTPKGLRAAIILTWNDGTQTRIDTDESWTWTDSCVVANALYAGEDYDATRGGFESHPAVIDMENAPKGNLIPNEMPHVRVIRTFDSVQNWEADGGMMFDFGINIQGIARIEVEAPAGTKLSLQYSEMICADGTPDLRTNRNARAQENYTCAGSGKEIYSPFFTYHGFRYVKVTGLEHTASFKIQALQMSADVTDGSRFACSEPIVNRVHELCTNSIRNNLVSIPTDCPVRDERTPCLMDSQMYEDAAMYNFGMHSYYRKWLDDISLLRSSKYDKLQRHTNMDWYGDTIMLNYRIYLFYGDLAPAKMYYDQMKRDLTDWMEESEDGTWEKGYGDWCLPNNDGWENYFGCVRAVNTSLLHAYTGIMAEFARLLGKAEDEKIFTAYGERVRTGMRKHMFDENDQVQFSRQTDLAAPLFYRILEGEDRKKALDALVKKVKEDGHFDTGGFGTRTMLPVLAEAGALDVAMDVLRESSYPGFGFWDASGATSLWEQWAYFGSMHSHSHAMHSGIDAALFHVFCGVEPTSPAFATFRIRPQMPAEMRWCACTIDSCSGKIEVSVEQIHNALTVKVTVPPNTKAELMLPEVADFEACVLYDGERRIERTRELHLGSGRYCFRVVPEKYLDFK